MATKKKETSTAPATTPQSTETAAQPTALATSVPAAIVPKSQPHQHAMMQFTDEQVQLIKDTVARGATNNELAWFLHVSKTLRLDPLRKQIYCIKRKMKDGQDWKEVLSIQTGIDGFRAIADRTRCYAPSEKPAQHEYLEKPQQGNRPATRELFSTTVWVKKFTPIDRTWHEFPATAILTEYMPLERRDGQLEPPFMWKKSPHNQLEKCAEAKALRRGFPDELGDIYVHEEMARLDLEAAPTSGPDTPQSRVDNKNQRERGTLEAGKEANRGHDNEGFRDEPKTQAIAGEVVSTAQPANAPLSPKEQKQQQQAEKIRVIETIVNQIIPKSKNLTKQQVEENAKAKKDKKDEPHIRQPYFILQCPDELWLYVWDQHLFKAALRTKGKTCVFGVSDQKANDKTFVRLEEIAGIGGVRYTRDPKTRDFVPEADANPVEVPPAGPQAGSGFEQSPDEPPLFP